MSRASPALIAGAVRAEHLDRFAAVRRKAHAAHHHAPIEASIISPASGALLWCVTGPFPAIEGDESRILRYPADSDSWRADHGRRTDDVAERCGADRRLSVRPQHADRHRDADAARDLRLR